MESEREDAGMIDDSARRPFATRNALLAVGVGGLIVGALDLTQAMILFGANIPLSIAGGLLGRQAFQEASPPMLSASSCTSSSPFRPRPSTTRPAAAWCF